jgi:hypothetical protein
MSSQLAIVLATSSKSAWKREKGGERVEWVAGLQLRPTTKAPGCTYASRTKATIHNLSLRLVIVGSNIR